MNNVAVFLDRDGVINKPIIKNRKPFAPTTHNEFAIYPEAAACVLKMHSAGFRVIIVTNQKDVGKKIIAQSELEEMHASIHEKLKIDEIKVCICTDECACYKPNPGMLLEAKNDWNLDLKKCFIIGDTWRDIGAGFNVGCKTILIERCYNMPMPYTPNFIVKNLQQATSIVLKHSLKERK